MKEVEEVLLIIIPEYSREKAVPKIKVCYKDKNSDFRYILLVVLWLIIIFLLYSFQYFSYWEINKHYFRSHKKYFKKIISKMNKILILNNIKSSDLWNTECLSMYLGFNSFNNVF